METVPFSEHEGPADLQSLDKRSDQDYDCLIGKLLSSEKRFDASQYAFFGRDVTHEVEIGGLDEEDYTEQGEVLDGDREKMQGAREILDGGKRSGSKDNGCASDVEEAAELAVSFMQLQNNRSSSEGDIASSGNLSTARKLSGGQGATSSSQAFEPFSSNWLDHLQQETLVRQGAEESWPDNVQKLASAVEFVGPLESCSLQIEQHQWHRGDSSPVRHPPTHQTHQPLPHISPHGQVSCKGLSLAEPGRYGQPYVQSPYGITFPTQYASSGSIMTPLAPPARWVTHSNAQHESVSGSYPQQQPLHSPLLPPQVVLQFQPHVPQLHGISPHRLLKPHPKHHATPLGPQILPRIEGSVPSGDPRDLFSSRGRQNQRHQQCGVADGHAASRNAQSNVWQPSRSKYMTVEEIENIVRIQWAATHSNDPYVDDYYHQAMLTKLCRPHGRRHFAPSHLRDLPSHTRAAVEPHAYLQVDALGRVPFSSIRRPRPLLEVDSGLVSGGLLVHGLGDSLIDGVPQYRPLEQEPMLAARIAIEEGLCLLLDVDDIDRLLISSQPPDGGAQLKRRRQLLIEGLAASLQLVGNNGDDPGVPGLHGCFASLANKGDLLFLRLLSLPKGMKLLTRYLQLITPGSELIRVVVVAVFRHLRYLFGGVQADPNISAATAGLASSIAVAVMSMDLSGLSTSLGAVLLAPDQPPLRPMGSPAGDGATVVLRALFERATGLLTDRNAVYPLQNRAVWQASFDAFFALLAKYCTNKYDSIFHSLMMASSSSSAALNATAAAAMSKEMPVELLRASLPHTNDHQRNMLLEFTQRSMSRGSFPLSTVSEGDSVLGRAVD